METVSFGRTGLKVSKLCFGTMTIGSSKWKPWVLDEAAAQPLLKRCLDLGITFFDTANWYSLGESERVVGSTLTSMVPRDQLVLATKAYYPMSDDPNDRGLSRKHLLSSVEASLRRLLGYTTHDRLGDRLGKYYGSDTSFIDKDDYAKNYRPYPPDSQGEN